MPTSWVILGQDKSMLSTLLSQVIMTACSYFLWDKYIFHCKLFEILLKASVLRCTQGRKLRTWDQVYTTAFDAGVSACQ